jgi:hypothetical protein
MKPDEAMLTYDVTACAGADEGERSINVLKIKATVKYAIVFFIFYSISYPVYMPSFLLTISSV